MNNQETYNEVNEIYQGMFRVNVELGKMQRSLTKLAAKTEVGPAVGEIAQARQNVFASLDQLRAWLLELEDVE